jgi:hypothetical protein
MIVAPLAALPLVVALAIVGGWALHTQGELRDQVALNEELEAENAELASRAPVEIVQLASDETQEFELASTLSAIGGRAGGNLIAFLDQPVAIIKVWNLPTEHQRYEVLLRTRSGGLISAGEFGIDPTGSADNVTLNITEPISDFRSLHVRPVMTGRTMPANDSFSPSDVLWVDMDSSLGESVGTEANANAR